MLRSESTVIAYAHSVHPNGGMERAQSEVILGLLRHGWRVRVVARSMHLPAHPNLEFVPVNVPRRPAALEQLTFAARAPRMKPGPGEVVTSLGAIVPWPVDVVIVQYINRMARGMRTVNGTGATRTLLRVSGAINHRIAVGLERWCYRPGRVERFLPVSAQLQEGLRSGSPWCGHISQVVPNGVDCDHFAPNRQARERTRQEHSVAPDDHLAVFVGGDWDRKGLGVAIQALALAPQWQLLVVGRGTPTKYQDAAAQLGCANRLHFAGESKDPAPLLAAGDVFVLPTRYEGFPLAAIEAASTGLPLLLTRESNADGLLVPGSTGFWVDRNAESIAARLTEFSEPTLRAQVSRAARLAAERYSWADIAEQHIKVYSEIRDSRTGGARAL